MTFADRIAGPPLAGAVDAIARDAVAAPAAVPAWMIWPLHQLLRLILCGIHTLARWSYAAAKLVGEHFASAYAREHGLEIIALRLFNIIGPRQRGVEDKRVGHALIQPAGGAASS